MTLILAALTCGSTAFGEQQSSEDVTVTASRLRNECSRLVNARNASEAEAVCRRAVDVANQLPRDAVLERSGARAWLGHALLFQRKSKEALEQYTQELELVQSVLKPTEAEVASAYRHLAMAHFLLGDPTQADQQLGRAASIMETAIINLPSEKVRYQEQLRTILGERAQVKRQLGDEVAAAALEKKARELAVVP
jgi:hypothetical protein